jgi:hypothetical protein
MTQEQQQSKFYDFVCELMEGQEKETTKFASVVSMLHTLIEENYLDEVDTIFRKEFPEYYVDSDKGDKDWKSQDTNDPYLV